jgi:RecA/RadA recombinase
MAQIKKRENPHLGIAKFPTGIPGLDEITNGGLPTESMR